MHLENESNDLVQQSPSSTFVTFLNIESFFMTSTLEKMKNSLIPPSCAFQYLWLGKSSCRKEPSVRAGQSQQLVTSTKSIFYANKHKNCTNHYCAFVSNNSLSPGQIKS